MDEGQKQMTIMECSLSYSLSDMRGAEISGGEAKAKLDEGYLSILPNFGAALLLSLRDIVELSMGDYRVSLSLSSNEKLTLFNLGYKFEDFLRILSRLRNQMLLKDMLMHESLRKSGVEAEFVFFDETGRERHKGKCEPQLYDTGMVIIPEKGELTRIPYSDIRDIKEEGRVLALNTDGGERIVFSMMGRQFESFKKTLSETVNELSLKVQLLLKEMVPEASPAAIWRAASFMKEGKAARKADIGPDMWKELEKKLKIAGIREGYDFLKNLAQKEKMCIGLKRGLLGDLTGEYIWIVIPLYSIRSEAPGNAVAIEAGDIAPAIEPAEGDLETMGGAKATYFFRIVSRKDYPKFKNIDDLDKEVDTFIKRMNRCMLAINFRREPIYLPDNKLNEPQYQKYLFAIQKIPSLRELRQLFIGRVLHSSPEQWKKDVTDLLKFNMNAKDDNERWKKGQINE